MKGIHYDSTVGGTKYKHNDYCSVFEKLMKRQILRQKCIQKCSSPEPASPGPDSDTTMDTMEVDSSELDGSRGLDDPEEPSTPDGMFVMDSPFMDREKDEEPIKTIR